VVRVLPGGGAAQAGIKASDIIVSINGRRTGSVDALTSILATSKPGQAVQVRYTRNGTSHTVAVTLGNLSS